MPKYATDFLSNYSEVLKQLFQSPNQEDHEFLAKLFEQVFTQNIEILIQLPQIL